MKKRRIKINMILGIILCIVLAIMFYCFFDIYKSLKSNGAKEVEVIDKIDGYDYQVDENDSPYFQKLFKDLKKVLSEKQIDEEEYASVIAKLFVTDFYSLNYATSKNDVGGVQFVYKDYQDDFIHKAKDSVYKYVENNLYGKRNQDLPVVSEVTISSITSEAYSYDNDITDKNAYIVNVDISYEEDLDYPSSATLVIIHRDNVLEVSSME